MDTDIHKDTHLRRGVSAKANNTIILHDNNSK